MAKKAVMWLFIDCIRHFAIYIDAAGSWLQSMLVDVYLLQWRALFFTGAQMCYLRVERSPHPEKKTMGYKINLVMSGLLCLLCGCSGGIYRVDKILNYSEPRTDVWLEGENWFADGKQQINPLTYNGVMFNSGAEGQRNTVDVPGAAAQRSPTTTPVRSLFQDASDPNLPELVRKTARNRLQDAILAVSDNAVAGHLAALKSTDVSSNLILSVATSALSGGASIAGAPTASYLAAGGAFTNASRGFLNEQVYRNALVETLTAAIESDRARIRAELQDKRTQSTTDYTVEAAIGDAQRYHESGSFYRGLELIRDASQKANAEALQNAKMSPELKKAMEDQRIEDEGIKTEKKKAERIELNKANIAATRPG